MPRNLNFKRLIAVGVVSAFLGTSLQPSYAQKLALPAPGTMVNLSSAYVPVLIKGLKVHPENPLLFDFILDTGKSGFNVNSPAFKDESEKLIKYFLASLTIKEDDLWVNLSPYEKNRIIPDQLGQTELGQDMLAQDYILKQLTASLIYPEKQLGKEFWNTVYAKAQQEFGTSDIPVNTFNKVWIIADKAKILERNNVGYVVGSHLKVMLEEDYMALKNHTAISQVNKTHTVASQVVREIIIPALDREVNQGQNFAPLRQMFYSMILASWYKLALKDALLNRVYTNKGKTGGVLSDDPMVKEKIFQQYLEAYKKGVFNYIKEDMNTGSEQPTPRKYFSGGERIFQIPPTKLIEREHTLEPGDDAMSTGDLAMATVHVEKQLDSAMLGRSDIDSKIEQAVGNLNTSESVWAVLRLLGGGIINDLNISQQARAKLTSAFGRNPSEIEAMVLENKKWFFSPKTWRPQARTVKLIQEVIEPKYSQLISDESNKLIAFIGHNNDLEVAVALDDLVNIANNDDIFKILVTPIGNRLLLQVSNIFGTSDVNDLTVLVSAFLIRIKNDTNKIQNIREEAKKKRLFLWHEQRKASMGPLDSQLSSFAASSDWDNYSRILVEAINAGTLKNLEYINYYLENSQLLQRSQEKDYRAVTKAAKAKGVGDIVLNERLAVYKRAREAVTGQYGLNYDSMTIPANASVILSLNPQNSPDLTDEQRQELYKKAREAILGRYGLNYDSKTIPGNARVILSLNAKNSPDLTDEQRNELYKKAREAVTGQYGLNYDPMTIPANASVILSLNPQNSPDLTDEQRQELYKKAREAVLGRYGLNYDFKTIPGNARVILSLNAKNSPDLTDEQRNELYKKAREAVTGQYGLNYDSMTIPANASVILSLNPQNSPDLTDEQRQELYKKAREAVLGRYGLNYDSKTIPANAGIIFSLNAQNSPDLTDEQRQDLYKQAREAVLGPYGLNYDSKTIPGNARVLLGPANLIIDMIEGSMMTWSDLQDATSNLSTHDVTRDDIIPGISNELLIIGAILYLSMEHTDFQGEGMHQHEQGDTGLHHGQTDLGVEHHAMDTGFDHTAHHDFDLSHHDLEMSHHDFDTSHHDFGSSHHDFAMNADLKGGIDLNAKNMAMSVSGQGMQMKFDPAMVAEFQRGNFSGVVANIIRITPIKSALSMMGLEKNSA